MMQRKPMAISNWKMAMTIAESLAWVRDFRDMAGDLLDAVDVVICPPYTALWAVAQALGDDRIQLGGQNIAPTDDPARTGEISAALLADVGCRWVLLGHWEVRRHLHDDDEIVNRKVHLALEAGLAPILLIGEAHDDPSPLEDALDRQLTAVLAGCTAEQVAGMAFVYEPEGAIGVTKPATPDHVVAGCAFIRGWLRGRWGDAVAGRVRIIYGGSVAPEYAAELLACPDVDGLGATRRGRDPATFTQIVHQIAQANV
ncbi:MAG: triosephosphate isomerase [Chloroflexi bacterium]|nr:triosephosphate isomerase [Chloroflexota bacterium]